MAGRRRLISWMAGLLALWAAAAPPGLPLDLKVVWPPVLSEGTLFLFGAGNRVQLLHPGEAAPQCSPAPVTSIVPPLAGGGAVWAVDEAGNLWRLGEGLPRLVEGGCAGALRLLPTGVRPAVLLTDRLLLPDGRAVALPFEAKDGNALDDGGFWIRGRAQALRLAADGTPLFAWKPPSGEPGPALLHHGRIYSGSSSGELWTLTERGRPRFRFRAGGELSTPPVAAGDLVVFATSNHFVRAIDGKGRIVWHFRLEGRPLSGPLLLPQGIFLSEAEGSRLLLLSPADGKVRFSWRCPEGDLRLPPAVSSGKAYVLSWAAAPEPLLHVVDLPAPKAEGDRR